MSPKFRRRKWVALAAAIAGAQMAACLFAPTWWGIMGVALTHAVAGAMVALETTYTLLERERERA